MITYKSQACQQLSTRIYPKLLQHRCSQESHHEGPSIFASSPFRYPCFWLVYN